MPTSWSVAGPALLRGSDETSCGFGVLQPNWFDFLDVCRYATRAAAAPGGMPENTGKIGRFRVPNCVSRVGTQRINLEHTDRPKVLLCRIKACSVRWGQPLRRNGSALPATSLGYSGRLVGER